MDIVGWIMIGQSPPHDDYRWLGGILLAVIYVIMHVAGKLKKDKEPEKPGPVLRRERPPPTARPAPPPARPNEREVVVFESTSAPARRPAPAPRPAPTRTTAPAARRDAPERVRGAAPPSEGARGGPGSLARAASGAAAPPSRRTEPPEGESFRTPVLVDIHAPQPGRPAAAVRGWHDPALLRGIARSPQQIAFGVVLAEILAPPVALRDNHLLDRW